MFAVVVVILVVAYAVVVVIVTVCHSRIAIQYKQLQTLFQAIYCVS